LTLDILGFVAMGAVDGLNICSLSLLTLFVSLMYTSNASRQTIVVWGLVYIASVFTSYFLLGLGILLLSVSIPLVPHFLARFSVALLVFIGGVNVISYLRPGSISLNLPMTLGTKAIKYMRTISLPALFVAGLLVGLHNLPCACTGGLYPSFIALISGTGFQVGYLLIYNMAFTLPLLAILSVSSSKAVTLRVRRWHVENSEKMKLGLGLVMLAVAAVILLLIQSGAI